MSLDDTVSETEIKVPSAPRQDAYVIFTNEKDLRHAESIRIKSALYTGIAIRVKFLTLQACDSLLKAIEKDANPD